MKKFLLSMMLLSAASAYSQDRWSIGAFYSIDRQILADNIASPAGYGYHNLEQSGPSYTTGIQAQVKIASRWWISTGVAYSRKDYSANVSCPNCVYLTFTSSLYSSYPQVATIPQQFIEVPALMRYYVVQKKFILYAEAGLTANFLMQNSPAGMYDYATGVDVKSFIVGGQIGIGTGYTIGKAFEINLGTVYRNSITEYVDSSDTRLRSFGAIASVAYKF
jgi:hypothetical protein